MFYDTHAHVDASEYQDEYEKIISDSLEQGVWINNVGTKRQTSLDALENAKKFNEGVYAIVGVHPTTISDYEKEKFDYDFYLDLAKDPKVVGIGECGLDYYRLPEGSSIEEVKAIQLPAFREHIRLAKELDKVLVVHVRASKDTADAYLDCVDVLSEYPGIKFLVHSFSANWNICSKFLELGGYVGLNAIITFDKAGALKEVLEKCSLERIVLETDAPYLAPAPFRGKKNFPVNVKLVAQFLADNTKNDKGESRTLGEIENITTATARKLFGV